MYSYEKQIERLLEFTQRVHDAGCDFAPYSACAERNLVDRCLSCQAYFLLKDEPVRVLAVAVKPETKYNYPRYF